MVDMKRRTNEDGEDLREKKVKRKKEDLKEEITNKKEKKRASKTQKDSSSAVQVDSLQSIFASSTKEDATFTLFGDDAPSEPIQPTLALPPIEVNVAEIPSAKFETKRPHFFPHFDSPEKNAHSLFAIPDELFFHNRTEYDSISLIH